LVRDKEVEKVKNLLSGDFSFDVKSDSVEIHKVEFKSMQELLDYCAELKRSVKGSFDDSDLDEYCDELIDAWFSKFVGSKESQGGDEE